MNDLNPFGNEAAESVGGAVAAAGEAREIAEVKAAMAVAQMYPRDQRKAMDRILNSCARPTLAEKAQYAFARGGQEMLQWSRIIADAESQLPNHPDTLDQLLQWSRIIADAERHPRAAGHHRFVGASMEPHHC